MTEEFARSLELYIHNLEKNSTFWGKIAKNNLVFDGFNGAHVSDFDDADGSKPNIFLLMGRSLEMLSVDCLPPVESL